MQGYLDTANDQIQVTNTSLLGQIIKNHLPSFSHIVKDTLYLFVCLQDLRLKLQEKAQENLVAGSQLEKVK